MTTPEEQAAKDAARRAEKERIRQENAARFQAEVPQMLRDLPPGMTHNDLVMEHQKLRMKSMEMQQMVITGKLPVAVEQDLSGKIVEQIHKVEARIAELSGAARDAVGKGKGPGF
ncbi:MAG TPA: hypothetical protein VNZ52_05770 [Candidatus Thermoplasmatota archaeon]|nr:hypothetical protein [Candidatus Thermoplasmatota archaeon]